MPRTRHRLASLNKLPTPLLIRNPRLEKTRSNQGGHVYPHRQAAKKAGIIYAHGGPSGQTTVAFGSKSISFVLLDIPCLPQTHAVVLDKAKNSKDLNNGDWGGGDYQDYEYGRRFLATSEDIDAGRIGITGGSFGGYMTNWAMVQPDNQFGFGISDYGMADLYCR